MARLAAVSLRFVRSDLTGEVPSPPHDALSAADRARHLADNPRSYLGVTRAPDDIEPGIVDPAGSALRAGRHHLEKLLADGVFEGPTAPGLFVYRLEQDGHTQTALVCGVATSDYDDGTVRIHERVNRGRALHLARHLEVVGAQSSPIALAFAGLPQVRSAIAAATEMAPVLDFTDEEGLRQQVWAVDDAEAEAAILAGAADAPLYLIDGHHRAAAASEAKASGRGVESAEPLMLCAAFPIDELRNQAFHRILSGLDPVEVGRRLTETFPVRRLTDPAAVAARAADELAVRLGPDGDWLVFPVPFSSPSGDALADIDPLRLADHVLGPVLDVDERADDERLSYRPGLDDRDAVESIDLEAGQVLFLMRPVPMSVLMAAADDGEVMPPKSTYFLPKVRSGLFVRIVDRLLP